ncbi:MAG: hypothetical protein O3A47_02875 [Chloroflexi bacterium]|nr:hypothetical protein [Chloroflexota bacterium]
MSKLALDSSLLRQLRFWRPAVQAEPRLSDKCIGQAITAEVCTEGEARDTIVTFKNLDDFEWQDIEFTLEKGGETYTLGDEPQRMRPGRDKQTSWPPQSVLAAEAFTDSGEFTRRGDALWVRQSSPQKPVDLRTTVTSSVTVLTISLWVSASIL